ncbi:MAG: nitrogenase component 1 [Propionibacterium sp.]|nr:nitrogenase component 1 [Propionibacterium sp.]
MVISNAPRALVDQDRAPSRQPSRSTSTTNACRMCMPLGACLAYTGFEGTVPFLHGSQGCATYIRRYLISHFSEPMDIASSSVGEAATVFGGEENLRTGIANVARVYHPSMIGLASTCLTETIGEDVPAMIARLRDPDEGLQATTGQPVPRLAFAPTPSYAGTHADGFHAAVAAVVKAYADADAAPNGQVNVFPGIVSAADLRHLNEIVGAYGLPSALMPDYSDRMDGVTVARYEKLPAGGTTAAAVAASGSALASITLGGMVTPGVELAGRVLAAHAVPHYHLPLPIGIRLTDQLTDLLGELSGRAMPEWLVAERGRLVDAYIDAHKYAMDRTAIVFGDEDLVVGLASFVAEIGITPVLVASGGRSGRLAAEITRLNPTLEGRVEVLDDGDFTEIEARASELKPDLLIGHSKGYPTSRRLDIPLVRVGLPIHDRVGGQRIKHLGYRGAQDLLDRVVNTLIQRRQDTSPVGYAYM